MVTTLPPGASSDAANDEAHVLDQAFRLLHTHRGDPTDEVEQLLARFPGSVAAHRLRAALIVAADRAGARAQLATSVEVIVTACPEPDHADHRHALAARAWLDRDVAGALERYGAIVIDWPRDLLALVVVHALDFRLGRRGMLRDRLAQVLPEWDSSLAGFPSVLAMYAFGLEENGRYEEAEQVARRAFALEPGHPGATHALAHVMEMQGRARDGLGLMAGDAAAATTGFAAHLAWHRALFHLELDEAGAALGVYDADIAPLHGVGQSVLADASALLWRLQLRGVDVAARWRRLADRWEQQSLGAAGRFNILHAVMAFSAAGRGAAAQRAVAALDSREAASPLNPEVLSVRSTCRALLAFARGEYAACVERLREVLHLAHRCGGSLAQCDVVHLTYTEAALRARDLRLARALVAERAARRPASRISQLLLARLRALNLRGRDAALA